MKKIAFYLIIMMLQVNLFGQDNPNNEVRICDQTIPFSQDCIAKQEFQSVQSDEFHLMWLYLVQKSGMEGWSIYKDNNGEISYTSNYSLDYIRKNGFSIYPKKKDEVIITPTEFVVLGMQVSGNIIEIKGKRSSLFYLTASGNICDREIGFQVKLTRKTIDNTSLSKELKKIIKFKED